MNIGRVICALAAGLSLIGHAAEARAQSYPDRSIRMIVVNPPGGGVDVVARIIAKGLNDLWHQPVVVDNRGGASGMIAGAAVANSTPDGYTMLMSASEVALNVALFPKMQYDPVTAFAPVSLIARTPMVLVTVPGFPAKSVQEFVAYLKANPGALNYGSGGVGTPQHFAMELLRLRTGTQMTHIPFKSGGLQVLGLLGGEVTAGFVALPPALPHIRSGKLVAIAVSSLERWPSLPDVPTLAQSGFPGFDVTQWYAAWLPSGVPKEIVATMATAIQGIARSAEFRSQMEAVGSEAVGSSAEALGQFRASEIAKYRSIADQAGIKAD